VKLYNKNDTKERDIFVLKIAKSHQSMKSDPLLFFQTQNFLVLKLEKIKRLIILKWTFSFKEKYHQIELNCTKFQNLPEMETISGWVGALEIFEMVLSSTGLTGEAMGILSIVEMGIGSTLGGAADTIFSGVDLDNTMGFVSSLGSNPERRYLARFLSCSLS